MARPSANRSLPPPLRALGGWPDAEWFDRAVLAEDHVVGLTLPRLAGLRKQSFDLAERSARESAPGKRAAIPDRAPSGIAGVLEGVMAARAAAFRRPRFFFEAAPSLFFADIPAARLKPRAADALRKALIGIGYRGCVLVCGPRDVIAMFWPEHEVDVTAFVRAAEPPYPLHAQFDQAEAQRPLSGRARVEAAAKPARGTSPGAAAADRAERDLLLAELDSLRARIAELQRGQSVLGALETLGLDDARLRAMLLLLHPDRHANSAAATEAAKWVNGLRDALKAKPGS